MRTDWVIQGKVFKDDKWPSQIVRVKVTFQGQERIGTVTAQSSYGRTYVNLDYDEKSYRVFKTEDVRLLDGRSAPRRKK